MLRAQNETHKILWDIEIQTDHKIPARRPRQMIINKITFTRAIYNSDDITQSHT